MAKGAVIGALRAELSASIAQFVNDMNKGADAVASASKRMQRAGKQMAQVGTNMTKYVTAPVLAAGAGIIKVAGDFEAGMNRVRAVTGASGAVFQEMRDKAAELGRTTQYSATQSADAMEVLAKNGLNAADIMGGAVDASLSLAAATGADLANAADIATDVMANFNRKANEMDKVVDGITGTTLASKFGIEEYAEALGAAGGVAGGLGVEFEDFNAAIAATSSSFKSGAAAGTSFAVFLQRLVPEGDKAKNMIKALRLEFFNADGSMKNLTEIAEELRAKLGHFTDQELVEAMKTLFGQRAMRTGIALMRQGAEGIEKFRAQIAAASAEEQAEARLQGFNGELTKLKSALEGLAIAIADAGLLQWATGLVANFSELVSRLAETNPALLKMGTIIAGVAAAGGPLLIFIGNIVRSIGILLPLLAGLGKALLLLAANPIGAVITAVGLLVIAFLQWEEGVEMARKLYQGIKTWLVDKLGPVIQKVKGWAVSVGQAFGVLPTEAEKAEQETKKALEKLKGSLDEDVKKPAKDATDSVGRDFKSLEDLLNDMELTDKAASDLQQLKDKIDPISAAMREYESQMKLAESAGLDLAAAQRVLGKEFISSVGGLDELKGKLAGLPQSIRAVADEMKKTKEQAELDKELKKQADELERFGKSVTLQFDPQAALDERIKKLDEALSAGVITLKTYEEASKDAFETFDEASKKGDESFKRMDLALDRIGQQIMGLVTGTNSWKDSILNLSSSLGQLLFIEPFLDSLKGFATDWMKGFGGGGGGDWGGIVSGIGSAFGGFFADGGNVMPGKSYVVGEEGPELFRPNASGEIVPNGESRGGIVQNFNISTPDANSFRASQRQIARLARQKIQMG